jgi:hypothetical protein
MAREFLALEFPDLSTELAHAVVDRINAAGSLRVVSATAVERDTDGRRLVTEWPAPRDLFDVAAEAISRRFAADDDPAGALEPRATVLLLLVEHLWVRSLHADVEALGGRCTASRVLRAAEILAEERRFRPPGGNGDPGRISGPG